MKKTQTYYDYCLELYEPIADVEGKFSSDALLENSLEKNDYQKEYLSLTQKVRNQVGLWNTVWGTKLESGTLYWELYFYNHGTKEPQNTVTSLLDVFRAYFEVDEFLDIDVENQPYFMFSIDLNDEIFKSKRINGVNLYMQGRKGIFQGNSYYWGREGVQFENHYDFYLARKEAEQFIDKLKQSVVFGKHTVSFLKNELVRKLLPCHRICVANKKNSDGVYFSRVNVYQLIPFLEYFSYPAHIVNFVRSNAERLDHLLYDVAFDVTFGPKGFAFGKSSYYGVF